MPAPEAQAFSRYSDDPHHQISILEDKRPQQKRDCVRKRYNQQRLISKIHNKYYDLTNFKHPGGPIALALIDGRDGTELFESHHLFTNRNMKQILERYEITGEHPDDIPSSNVFDWEWTMMDPFTIELHQTARRVLG
jgi:cytochrome b involved in lipid metabolism